MIDILKIVALARDAGSEIMAIYNRSYSVETKKDNSPLTEADRRSHNLIESTLQKLYPDIPVLSEEGKSIPPEIRQRWKQYWLVDPLDGTKEFIKKNGEFTVNIAFMVENRPHAGVVFAPARDIMYYADEQGNSYKQVAEGEVQQLSKGDSKPDIVRVVGSRSHPSSETEHFISDLKEQYGQVEVVPMGSSLKICLVADGSADIYPRLGPTSEWDTAAAHSIVLNSGKNIFQYGTDLELAYNKNSLRNGWFIVK